MLESVFSEGTQVSISFGSCLICILVSIILGVVISFTHKMTTKTTPNFLLTLTVLPVLVQVVIFLVNGNLGTAFAVAGAFGLVRFRSMPGNSKEIVSVFGLWPFGLGLGMGFVTYTIFITIIVAVLVIAITKFVNKTQDLSARKLKIVIPEDLDYDEVFNDIFKNIQIK